MTGISEAGEIARIPQRELRNDSGRVLREVRAGRSYVITVDGEPVADLVPHSPASRRTSVPRDEVLRAFAPLRTTDGLRRDDAAGVIDDSLYDPYDRAYRRGEFAPGPAV